MLSSSKHVSRFIFRYDFNGDVTFGAVDFEDLRDHFPILTSNAIHGVNFNINPNDVFTNSASGQLFQLTDSASSSKLVFDFNSVTYETNDFQGFNNITALIKMVTRVLAKKRIESFTRFGFRYISLIPRRELDIILPSYMSGISDDSLFQTTKTDSSVLQDIKSIQFENLKGRFIHSVSYGYVQSQDFTVDIDAYTKSSESITYINSIIESMNQTSSKIYNSFLVKLEEGN